MVTLLLPGVCNKHHFQGLCPYRCCHVVFGILQHQQQDLLGHFSWLLWVICRESEHVYETKSWGHRGGCADGTDVSVIYRLMESGNSDGQSRQHLCLVMPTVAIKSLLGDQEAEINSPF